MVEGEMRCDCVLSWVPNLFGRYHLIPTVFSRALWNTGTGILLLLFLLARSHIEVHRDF